MHVHNTHPVFMAPSNTFKKLTENLLSTQDTAPQNTLLSSET